MPRELRLRRLALFLLFFGPGVAIASWVTRTPDVRDLLHASTAQMGTVLFGLSIGSMIGILGSGALVSRLGTRPIIAAGVTSEALGMVSIGVGAATGSSAWAMLGLALFGLGMGGAEVAMNIEGAEIERLLDRSVMPTLHGFFSLGTLVGAVVGMFLTAWRVPVVLHLVTVAVLLALSLALVIRRIPDGVGCRTRVGHGTPRHRPRVWRDRRLLGIGVVILALAMAEGTANDWLPLVMVDGHRLPTAWGSAIYAVFAAAMTMGRFLGNGLVDRFGRAVVLAISAALGALGLSVVIFVDNQVVAGLAVLGWGLGTSLGFPVAISAAGDSGPDTAARVSFAATVGYISFLVGPPLLSTSARPSACATRSSW